MVIKPSPKTSKLLATIFFTLFIFSAFIISGFTVADFEAQNKRALSPNAAGVIEPGSPNNDGDIQPALPQPGLEALLAPVPASDPPFRLTNVIKNGDFEKNPTSSVATYWQPFNNGQARFGWYAERWQEAVHSGKSSQLMEIFYVDDFRPNRIIGIYQTVEVVPNASYSLTIHALMRSSAPQVLRDQGEYQMDWGIDYGGTGKPYNVNQWITMPLSEQLRIGSNGPRDDNLHLFYQPIITTIHTANTSRLTLFIRGLKIEPTGTEINFNIDDVSLVGPYFPPPAAPDDEDVIIPTTGAPASTAAAAPVSGERSLPDAGATLPKNIPAGALALGGLVLIALGAGAANGVLKKPKNVKKIGQN